MYDYEKWCGNCKHWQYYNEIQGECSYHSEFIDIGGNNATVLTFDNCYCDEFAPSEHCIADARLVLEEEFMDEAEFNGVKVGKDFPGSL